MARDEEQVKKDFLRDRANPEVTIVQDNGLYRYIKIRNKPEVGHQFNGYDIITWPGILTINGDHGTWVFSRIEDMFAFFRTKPREGGEMYINPDYWAENIMARDRHRNAREFDADVFKAEIIDSLDGYSLFFTTCEEGCKCSDCRKAKSRKRKLIKALDEEISWDSDENHVRQQIMDFKYNADCEWDETFEFSDTWEIEGKVFTGNYIYCLYSIVWAIQQYDALKAGAAAPQEVAVNG